MTDPAPHPDLSEADLARFAASDTLNAAEVAWLRAVAACSEARRCNMVDDFDRSRALSEAERAAFLAYLRTPCPDGYALVGKLLAVERWASEIAQDGGDAVILVEALALVRADAIRLT